MATTREDLLEAIHRMHKASRAAARNIRSHPATDDAYTVETVLLFAELHNALNALYEIFNPPPQGS